MFVWFCCGCRYGRWCSQTQTVCLHVHSLTNETANTALTDFKVSSFSFVLMQREGDIWFCSMEQFCSKKTDEHFQQNICWCSHASVSACTDTRTRKIHRLTETFSNHPHPLCPQVYVLYVCVSACCVHVCVCVSSACCFQPLVLSVTIKGVWSTCHTYGQSSYCSGERREKQSWQTATSVIL